jgi:membrane glycosyltransferase
VWFTLNPNFAGVHPGPLQVVGGLLYLLLLLMGLFNLLLYLVGGGLPENGLSSAATVRSGGMVGRVAIVMPIYHEDTDRVHEGVRQTWLSAKQMGLDKHCDFYMLCDSADPIYRQREEEMYRSLLGIFNRGDASSGRLFLVRRSDRTNFKAGNIMNFIEKLGDNYDFMLVLDADSVMLGETIQRLISEMQARPRIAIIQSLIVPIGSITPFSRAMQYSIARCLPLYARGMLWFWGPESVYWGHNALVRIAPFRAHCQLPTLPGKPPFGGPILSQDIVEAAFLGRAGWEVSWDVECGGSFDELPSNILAYARRDRRWCQGNFQHSRFILSKGMKLGHRLYFANGIFAYLSGPLLLVLIVLSTWVAWRGEGSKPEPALLWGSLGLLWTQMMVPRLLGLLRASSRLESRRTRLGASRCVLQEIASTVGEFFLNLLLGPLLFYLHARFVLEILTGGHVTWKNQPRDPREGVTWRGACRVFWIPTLLGVLGILVALQLGFPVTLFLLPVAAGWFLSIPLAVWSANPLLGEKLASVGLFPDLFTDSEATELRTYSSPAGLSARI